MQHIKRALEVKCNKIKRPIQDHFCFLQKDKTVGNEYSLRLFTLELRKKLIWKENWRWFSFDTNDQRKGFRGEFVCLVYCQRLVPFSAVHHSILTVLYVLSIINYWRDTSDEQRTYRGFSSSDIFTKQRYHVNALFTCLPCDSHGKRSKYVNNYKIGI